MRRAVALTLALLASTAAAQPGATRPQPVDERDEGTALALSLGGTLGSYAALAFAIAVDSPASGAIGTIGAIGIVAAPTAGHWYAGRIVTRGLGLRAAGLVVLIAGGLADSEGCGLFYSGHGDPEPDDCGDNFRTTKGTALMAAGAALFLGGTVDDIITAPGAARRRNERARATLTLAPLVHHHGGGLALAGTF